MLGGRIKNPKRPTFTQFIKWAAIYAILFTLIPALPALIAPVLLIVGLYYSIKLTIWFWK